MGDFIFDVPRPEIDIGQLITGQAAKQKNKERPRYGRPIVEGVS